MYPKITMLDISSNSIALYYIIQHQKECENCHLLTIRERVTIWQNIKGIFISFVYCWTITHFYRIMVWKIKQRILTKRMQQHWSQLLFNIELSKMFLSMMFERSLKSNIDGIEHSLTFDQKKLAFEIMTSAFFFNISLCLGLQRLFFIWLMHILSISALILILHNYFFLLLKMFALEKNCVSLKKNKKTLAYQMLKILNTLYLPHTGMVSLTKVLRFELNTCLI